MNPFGYGKGVNTKLIAWKAKMDDLIQKVTIRGFEKRENVLSNIQDLKMPISEESSRIEQLNSERSTDWSSQIKNIDNGLVDMRGKYVLRTRPSWTGLYGKEPWPRERKQWEKI